MRLEKLRLQRQIELHKKPIKLMPEITMRPQLPKTDALCRYLKNVARKSAE